MTWKHECGVNPTNRRGEAYVGDATVCESVDHAVVVPMQEGEVALHTVDWGDLAHLFGRLEVHVSVLDVPSADVHALYGTHLRHGRRSFMSRYAPALVLLGCYLLIPPVHVKDARPHTETSPMQPAKGRFLVASHRLTDPN